MNDMALVPLGPVIEELDNPIRAWELWKQSFSRAVAQLSMHLSKRARVRNCKAPWLTHEIKHIDAGKMTRIKRIATVTRDQLNMGGV